MPMHNRSNVANYLCSNFVIFQNDFLCALQLSVQLYAMQFSRELTIELALLNKVTLN